MTAEGEDLPETPKSYRTTGRQSTSFSKYLSIICYPSASEMIVSQCNYTVYYMKLFEVSVRIVSIDCRGAATGQDENLNVKAQLQVNIVHRCHACIVYGDVYGPYTRVVMHIELCYSSHRNSSLWAGTLHKSSSTFIFLWPEVLPCCENFTVKLDYVCEYHPVVLTIWIWAYYMSYTRCSKGKARRSVWKNKTYPGTRLIVCVLKVTSLW